MYFSSVRRLRIFGLGIAALLAACAATSEPSATSEAADTSASGITTTLRDLATFGEKRVGTREGERAAGYINGRMKAIGLSDVHYEEFNFPMHVTDRAVSSVGVADGGGALRPIPFDVFLGSGNGRVENKEIVFVGSAKPADLNGKDLRGKIAFVERDSKYHRSTQYKNVTAAGAVAMLYKSTAVDNLIQIGSIRWQWEPMGPIPAVTIGKVDGEALQESLKAAPVRVTIDVHASVRQGRGRNVVGVVPGVDRSHRVVVGAHYDTWYVGSVDNSAGVAGLLALAEHRVGTRPAYDTVFVAFDGEEVALYGGYDYLRKHRTEGLLSVINLEMPSAEADVANGGLTTLITGLASSDLPALQESFFLSGSAGPPLGKYKLWLTLDFISSMFGGTIPTDIQGIYRSGIPTVSTASDSPYYYTTADTPDKVDTRFLASAMGHFDTALTLLMKKPVDQFVGHDSHLWSADVDVAMSPARREEVVMVTLKDEHGRPLPDQPVTATLFCNDFSAEPDVVVKTNAQSVAVFGFSDDQLDRCTSNRYVHVTAGKDYPLVEQVRALD